MFLRSWRIAIGTVLTFFCSLALAAEFSWQLAGGGQRLEVDDVNPSSSKSWGVDATYYVKPVDDRSGPYALASFLNPTTRISAAASESDSSDPTAYTLSGAYVLPAEKWYVGASYARVDGMETPGLVTSAQKGYGIRAGRYVGANTAVELGLGRSEQSATLQIVCPSPMVCATLALPTFETESDSVDLEVFHLRRFRSLTYTLQGRMAETDLDVTAPFLAPQLSSPTQRVYSFTGELFPTSRLGIAVGYSHPDADDIDSDQYSVSTTWFFKPRAAVQFSLARGSVDTPTLNLADIDSAGVRFIGRL